uniref:Uncharacterized protein n=1 Tax=candidate division WOR-3 bacterium TaxID=2052148 RepID=A0A7V3KNX7_UNCW3
MKGVILLLVILVFSLFLAVPTMAFPPLPEDLNVVQPDPSLPKELVAFFGKWEGKAGAREFFLIVEKINEEKATLRLSNGYGWETMSAQVVKEYGKWKIWFTGRHGQNELTLRGKYLDVFTKSGSVVLTRVP